MAATVCRDQTVSAQDKPVTKLESTSQCEDLQKELAVESRPDDRCGDCCKPTIHPSWVVQIRKTGFKEFLIGAPTRPLLHQTLAVTGEKLQNKATCVRPRHSSLLTATAPASILSPITSIPLSYGPRSAPQSIQTCLFHPWSTCTMTDSVCTTITDDTTGRAAGLVREKRKRISLEGEEEAGIRKRPRQDSDVLVQQTTPEGLVDIHRRKQSCLDKDWYVIGIYSVALSVSDLAQALRILKNYQVLIEATQQLEKILFGSGDAPIIASKILSRLSSEEMVLLSCTTTIDREDFSTLSDWQSSGYWFDEKEEEAFCRKFGYFMSGRRWDPRDILGKWENFYKVLTQSIHMWGTGVCLKVWEADRDIGDCDYSTILRKVKHQHRHRTYEGEKKAIRDRSGSVVQWDLVGMRVTVEVL
ncbi:hypothetical protein BKA61DRAFT_680685 [Leptodontidium sp. MPI-SDFR-AT-0119]|nr:hypothetical protein BKA61DRAFT_680685 [Leptodontidium sp. MPI-SDFR-AT-0119]